MRKRVKIGPVQAPYKRDNFTRTTLSSPVGDGAFFQLYLFLTAIALLRTRESERSTDPSTATSVGDSTSHSAKCTRRKDYHR